MANRNQKHESPKHSELIISRDAFKESIERRIVLGQELLDTSVTTITHLYDLESNFVKWDAFNSELLKASFDNSENEYRIAYNQSTFGFVNLGPSNPSDDYKDLIRRINIKVRRLEELHEQTTLLRVSNKVNNIDEEFSKKIDERKVFVVHGHDDLSKETVARLISTIGLTPLILHELPNAGKTIIEKFESNTEDVGFAVVLLTNDDIGRSQDEKDYKIRARQNVILELGYFIGKLGRNRVVPLYDEGVELPSDLSGIVYIPLDKSGAWKYRLSKELQHAGYKIDLNKI